MTEHATKIKQMEQAGEDTNPELEKLYFNNLAFVRKVGQPFTGRQEADDLLQEGFFALVKAVHYYDPSKGDFVSVYGKFLMTQFARMNDGRAYIPYHAREAARKFDKLTKEYIAAHGEEPPAAFYLEHMTAREIDTARAVLSQGDTLSLDRADEEHSDTAFIDYIPDTSGESVEDAAINSTYKEELKSIWRDVEELTTLEQAKAIRSVFQDGQKVAEVNRSKYNSGMERLKKQKKRFTPYLECVRDDAIYNEGVKPRSVSKFNQDGYSSTERAAFMMIDAYEKARLPIPEKYTPYITDYRRIIKNDRT